LLQQLNPCYSKLCQYLGFQPQKLRFDPPVQWLSSNEKYLPNGNKLDPLSMILPAERMVRPAKEFLCPVLEKYAQHYVKLSQQSKNSAP
jgi:hypothetical protein